MDCCHTEIRRKSSHTWWRGAGGCLGSGTLFLLLPKCPLCVAAWLTLWTGAGVAMPIATHLRLLLGVLFAGSAMLLLRYLASQAARRSRRNSDRRVMAR